MFTNKLEIELDVSNWVLFVNIFQNMCKPNQNKVSLVENLPQ